MGTPLSVLIVEDSASDAGLMVRHLQKAGFDVTHERVETDVQMRSSLQQRAWDIVLSDFRLPGFDAAAALVALGEADLDVPFIVVSGVIDEASAVGLMRAGAHDYLMKSDLARLAPAVNRELEEARGRLERRHAEEALRANERQLRGILENMLDVYIRADLEGRLVLVSPSAPWVYGYDSIDEMMAVPAAGLYADPQERQSLLEEIRANGRVHDRIGQGRKKDGSPFWISINAQHVRDENGRVIGFDGVVRDITNRKRAEAEFVRHAEEAERGRAALLSVLEDQREAQARLRESEERFRLLIEKSLSGMFVARDGVILYANPRMEEILGYGAGELVGFGIDALARPEDVHLLNDVRTKLKAGARSASFEGRAVRKDGSIIEIGVQAVVTKYDGQLSTVGAAQDITERKRTQEQIASYVRRLERSMHGTLEAVSKMTDLRDPYTAGHQRRVSALAAAIGAELGLTEDHCQALEMIGLVHDIGKIATPAEILSKPARLSDIEMDIVRGHAQAGFDILNGVDFERPLGETILQHHERLDGSGYPRGLKGDQIILEARIIAVADVVEAMASHRPYRPALGMDVVVSELRTGRGTKYDAAVVDAAVSLIGEKGFRLPA